MGGLVPLLLASNHGDRTSLGFPNSDAPNSRLPDSTAYPRPTSGHRRHGSSGTYRPRRLSIDVSGPPVPPPITLEDWKRAVEDVKSKYLNRKYRACSARCAEVLGDIKDVSNVEPLYLVSLHFYAAVSLETCARPLSPSSSFRAKLLRDARDHYDQAESLIKSAEGMTTQKTRSSSSASTTSSIPSPDLCHDSQSDISTASSSPRSSMCSVDGTHKKNDTSGKPKPKKKVSFSGLPDLDVAESWQTEQSEPFIRPDSPTLGWEDSFFTSRRDSAMPAPLQPKLTPPPFTAEPPAPAVPLIQDEEPPTETEAPDVDVISESVENRYSLDLDAFLQIQSMNRHCAHLSALRSQVVWHRNAVEALLAIPDETPAPPELPLLPPKDAYVSEPISATIPKGGELEMVKAEATSFSEDVPASPRPGRASTPTPSEISSPTKSHRCYSPDVENRFGRASPVRGAFCRPGSSMSVSSRPGSAASNSRGGDEALRERIERLRANGWQRKRFDARRYETLRETVLGELGG